MPRRLRDPEDSRHHWVGPRSGQPRTSPKRADAYVSQGFKRLGQAALSCQTLYKTCSEIKLFTNFKMTTEHAHTSEHGASSDCTGCNLDQSLKSVLTQLWKMKKTYMEKEGGYA